MKSIVIETELNKQVKELLVIVWQTTTWGPGTISQESPCRLRTINNFRN